MASTSSGATPVSATASEATPVMSDSMSSPSSRPNFECAQPAMQPVMSFSRVECPAKASALRVTPAPIRTKMYHITHR